jgi:tetratricopeptide (TPR) repeat protein
MSRMTYEDALRLFRKGHLQALLDNFKTEANARGAEARCRILFAYTLALTDHTSPAESLTQLDNSNLTSSVRSQLESTIGVIGWRAGNRESAWQHLHAAVRWARESNDLERLAWAHLHLFRFAIEAGQPNGLPSILRDARTAVTRAAIPYLTAYLHVCVSVLEGQRGNLDDATRHCDIAESLLQIESNDWVRGAALMSRAVIAGMLCEFKETLDCSRTAYELAKINGSRRNRVAADITSGHALLLLGEFDKAERTLSAALHGTDVQSLRTMGAADSLSRLYLALGQLDKCEAILKLSTFSPHDEDTTNHSMHAERWGALTSAKLLLRRGRLDEALRWLRRLETQTYKLGDRPFDATIHLLLSETLARAEHWGECARRVIKADSAHATRIRELQGQFHYSMGRIIRHESGSFGRQLQERAKRIWSSQRVVSVPLELGDSLESKSEPKVLESQKTQTSQVKTVLNCVGAMFDLAYNPTLVGAELLRILEMSGCVSKPKMIAIRVAAADDTDGVAGRVVFPLDDGHPSEGSVALECAAPVRPQDALVLTDIVRIARAAFMLERTQQEQRRRAAIWPARPFEDQAGALFIA